DPSTGTVEQLTTLPRPVAHAPLVPLAGALYLLGGDASNAVWRIDPSGSVRLTGRLPRPLANAAAVTLGGSAYLLGGDGSNAVPRVTPKSRCIGGAQSCGPLNQAAAVPRTRRETREPGSGACGPGSLTSTSKPGRPACSGPQAGCSRRTATSTSCP